ncbi:MAG: glycosyltransferase [Candidatus Omnitrophica bacterium]|nr:glycosyltransferase [Candidatus Omnitrophota bacterium]
MNEVLTASEIKIAEPEQEPGQVRFESPKRPLLERLLARPGIFFSLLFFFTLFQVRWFLGAVTFEPGSMLPYLLTFTFTFLSVNVSILATQAFFALFVKAPVFSRIDSAGVRTTPVALIYCVKNESFGIRERIHYSFSRNLLPNLHLWILSDSDEKHGLEEEKLIVEFRKEFGEEKVFYRRRTSPYERKQGNLKDWLVRFGAPYRYFIVCDADSLLPEGWVEEALSIAEHPDNSRIGVFQSTIYITHENSLYSRMRALGQFYAQRFYFLVNQAVLGQSISFGHNQLVRKEAFEKVTLPEGILSHDNWETALLDRAEYRVAFIHDLISYEEAPAHYLEERKRTKRWMKGTLQGWPLLFLPKISLSTRFLIFYQIYLYFVQPLLFFWMVSGLLSAASLRDNLFSWENTAGLLLWTLALIFLHKFAVARNLADAGRIFKEVLFTTLVGLQGIFYGTIDWITLPLEKMGWVPMSKNPGERPAFSDCVKGLLPGTLAGILLLHVGLKLSTGWTLYALPVITSLILSIPLVYLSSKELVASATIHGGEGEPK